MAVKTHFLKYRPNHHPCDHFIPQKRPANAIITPKNGPQMKPIFNRNLKKNRQNCHPHCNFYPQKRPANGIHILAHFSAFSKQLPNSHPYDYRHPYNHQKVHQNGPQMAPTFQRIFFVFKTTPKQPSL